MKDRKVIVTGGSSGIGKGICQLMLDAGYHVITLARRAPDFQHPNLESLEVDLADPDATREAAAEVTARHEITTLVNNAGVIRPAPIEDVQLADLDYLTNLHLGAMITLTQACLPAMKRASFGRIINMSSRAVVGLPTRTNYAGTKAAIISMTRTWAMELGHHGITVNAIAPGPIVTEMFHEQVPDDKARELAKGLPVGRLGRPEDIGRATLFLADENNGFITGQTLYICGGASLGSLTL